jgi:hypothetical protein
MVPRVRAVQSTISINPTVAGPWPDDSMNQGQGSRSRSRTIIYCKIYVDSKSTSAFIPNNSLPREQYKLILFG